MYVQQNNEAHLRNQCCCVKAKTVIYSVCVCVTLVMPCKVHVVYYIVICGLSGFTIFFHTI